MVPAVWSVGIEDGPTPALWRCPAGTSDVRPDLPYRHTVADTEQASQTWQENATVLYLPPGLAQLRDSPRLSLSERAALLFDLCPSAMVIAAALDEVRCWAQLRTVDPIQFTVDRAPAGFDPRVLASLLYRRRVPGRTPLAPTGHTLPEQTPIQLSVDGHPVQVRVERPDPAIDKRVDTAAPHPAPRVRSRTGTPPTWGDAERAARKLDTALAPGPDITPARATDQRDLLGLLAYAIASETGIPVTEVTIGQVRYRLGEADWFEDLPLARQRCLEWLYRQLWVAGHQVGALPALPSEDDLWNPNWHVAKYLARLAELDADDETLARRTELELRRDDPVTQTWIRLTRYQDHHEDYGGAEDSGSIHRWWDNPFTGTWTRVTRRADATLLARHGGWTAGTPVSIDPEHTGLIRAPHWTYDHTLRATTALTGYFVSYDIIDRDTDGIALPRHPTPIPLSRLHRPDP